MIIIKAVGSKSYAVMKVNNRKYDKMFKKKMTGMLSLNWLIILKLLLHMQIVGSYNSTANKRYEVKIWTNGDTIF